MTPVNQAVFDDSTSRRVHYERARGNSGKFGDGGIRAIQEDTVWNQLLYRVGHSTVSEERNLSSPWWLSEQGFKHIVAVAEKTASTFEQTFRIKCAVPDRFGVSDEVFVVAVQKRLRVLTGKGKVVVDDAGLVDTSRKFEPRSHQAWYGAEELVQIYIPGLRRIDDKDAPTGLHRSALVAVTQFRVHEVRSGPSQVAARLAALCAR